MKKKFSPVVKDLIFGILLYGILAEIIVLIVVENKVFYSLGLIFGLIAAAGMCINMQSALDNAMEKDENGAMKHIRSAYAIRTALVFLGLGFMFYFRIGSLVTGFIGIMGLKVAAYIQPLTHKFLLKYTDKGR